MREPRFQGADEGNRMLWLLPWKQDSGTRRMPWALYLLMALNAAVFAWMASLPDGGEALTMQYGLPADGARWDQFLVSDFLHADILHLLGNLLFLWLFGDAVEDALGPLPFLALYFAGGLLGDLLYVHNNVGTDIPSVGASGCISAIAGAYAMLFHDREMDIRIMLLVFPLKTIAVRALVVLVLWMGADLWFTLRDAGHLPDGGGVNYVAHGIGLICGLLMGLIARVQGVMRRYEHVETGSRWWGYWPESLERGAGRARMRRRR